MSATKTKVTKQKSKNYQMTIPGLIHPVPSNPSVNLPTPTVITASVTNSNTALLGINLPASVINQSYAAQVNSQLTSTHVGNIMTVDQRWNTTLQALPPHKRTAMNHTLNLAKAEFIRQYPTFKKFSDLNLVQARLLSLTNIFVDTTMQRLLNVEWVIKMLNGFVESKVMPVQVYDDGTGRYCAWDGQHTAVLLYLIVTQIFGENPDHVEVPVNFYSNVSKSQIRSSFVAHNGGSAKLSLDLIDIYQQMVYGVRIDGSKNPGWISAEHKQQILENHGLFVTAAKFNDTHMPGAISRLNEINKMDVKAVEWLCQYLTKVGCNLRPIEEKEIVMMAMYFDRCQKSNIKVDDQYIDDLVAVTMLWNADFEPSGPFWAKVKTAYQNWHNSAIKLPKNSAIKLPKKPRAKPEPVHGMPFFMAQLRKSFSHQIPYIATSSEFTPALGDLF